MTSTCENPDELHLMGIYLKSFDVKMFYESKVELHQQEMTKQVFPTSEVSLRACWETFQEAQENAESFK